MQIRLCCHSWTLGQHCTVTLTYLFDSIQFKPSLENKKSTAHDLCLLNSVTRWIDFFFIWPFSIMKICLRSIKLCQSRFKTMAYKNCQRHLQFWQSCNILPDLVTLDSLTTLSRHLKLVNLTGYESPIITLGLRTVVVISFEPIFSWFKPILLSCHFNQKGPSR